MWLLVISLSRCFIFIWVLTFCFRPLLLVFHRPLAQKLCSMLRMLSARLGSCDTRGEPLLLSIMCHNDSLLLWVFTTRWLDDAQKRRPHFYLCLFVRSPSFLLGLFALFFSRFCRLSHFYRFVFLFFLFIRSRISVTLRNMQNSAKTGNETPEIWTKWYENISQKCNRNVFFSATQNVYSHVTSILRNNMMAWYIWTEE